MNIGLVSVTFRRLSPKEIVEACINAKIDYIEWGSDIHIPPMDIENAKSVKNLTCENGIKISSYSTYFYAGEYESPEEEFKPYLNCACALNVPVIRMWAGRKSPTIADEEYYNKVASQLKIVCKMAEEKGITIGLECHGNCLTETKDSCLKILSMADCPNLKMYWQPDFVRRSHKENIDYLKAILDNVIIIHTFYWDNERNRFPLAEGEGQWLDYVKILESKKDIKYSLEFVPNDDVSLLKRETDTLKRFLKQR